MASIMIYVFLSFSVQYVDFLTRFSVGHIAPKIGHKFDIVHHKLKNKVSKLESWYTFAELMLNFDVFVFLLQKDGSEIGIRDVMDKIRTLVSWIHYCALFSFPYG